MLCFSSSLLRSPFSSPSHSKKLSLPRRRARSAVASSLRLGVEDLVDLAHNKVLVAATVSAAIGQLSKPLTSAIYGKGIDLSAAVRSGGMPSTHSALVAAAATSLGLDRGFSDSIFGMSAVFAVLVMYDAQGVRREVGVHAKILNKLLISQDKSTLDWEEGDSHNSKPCSTSINCDMSPLLSISEKTDSNGSNSESYSFQRTAITSAEVDVPSPKVDAKAPLLKNYSNCSPLNESVGHTEFQVIVGAILGFIVSLATNVIL